MWANLTSEERAHWDREETADKMRFQRETDEYRVKVCVSLCVRVGVCVCVCVLSVCGSVCVMFVYVLSVCGSVCVMFVYVCMCVHGECGHLSVSMLSVYHGMLCATARAPHLFVCVV